VAFTLLQIAAAATCLAGFTDDFDGATLNPAWTVVNPNPDSSVGLSGSGTLSMSASPLNGGSDLYPDTNYNAPRVLQAIDASSNWTIETEVFFDPANNYQDAGILLAKTASAFTSPDDYWRVAMRSFYPDGGGNVIRSVGNYVPYTGTTSYLKVSKQGTKYTGWWSDNGTDWILGGAATNTESWDYAGLTATRQPWDGQMSVYSNADFDYFRMSTVPEPSTLSLWGIALATLLLLRRRRGNSS
jgi:hypothetical protein